MKAEEILNIAKKWKRVFDNLQANPDINQNDLKMLAWINSRFIIVMQAENFIHHEQTQFAALPILAETNQLSPLNLHFLHINNVLTHYSSEVSIANTRRWASVTPHGALLARGILRSTLSTIVQLVLLCRDLFLLWTNQTTFAALLTFSHLSLYVVPLVVLGLWMLYDQHIYFPYENHSFNLANMPPSLKTDSILSGMRSTSGASFFEDSKNVQLIEKINTEYQRVQSLGC